MPPRFLYFDLGNVLLHFDHRLAARQMAEVAGLPEERVYELVFDSGMQARYEAGEISTREFYEAFCQQTGTRADMPALCQAAAAIFRVNASIVPVVAQLRSAGHRLGLLSNTCEAHWEYVASGRYGIIPDMFDTVVLSYRVGTLKPDERIFRAAAEAAGVAPEEIFYIDDIAGHVAGARRAGLDAVIYTTTPALVAELRRRGVSFNY